MISFFSRILELIAPRTCTVCGRRLSVSEQVLCATCNLHLPRTYYAKDAYNNEMAKLFWVRIPIERAAALFFYHAHSEASQLIYALKYGNQPNIGVYMGSMVAEEFKRDDFFKSIDFIVSIPLTSARKRKRGYNQSEEIAKGVHLVTGIPILYNLVKRVKFKESQTHKNRLERAENVEHAFQMTTNNPAIVGKHILLIDDIVTTGATICACATALQRYGEVRISVMSLGVVKR